MVKNTFQFELNEVVTIVISQEKGLIIARAEYVVSENTYLLRYATRDGTATEQWWGESALGKET
jgi:uncharacterized protein YhbP (UPF0306 family)